MTEQLAALGALVTARSDSKAVLAAFYEQWHTNPLVMDKWFAVQARSGDIEQIKALRAHADFDLGNPNRVRALIGVFAMQNLATFHAPDGSGYDFLAQQVKAVDPLNPSLAARLLTAFEQWRIFSANTQSKAATILKELSEHSLSQNCRDILARTLS